MDNFNYQAYIKSGKIHGENKLLAEAQATGFGTGEGRSKTVSKGKETNSDLKNTLKNKKPKKQRYTMKDGIPHKADGTPFKKLEKVSEMANVPLADLEERGYEAGVKAAYTHGVLVTKLQNRPDKLAYNKGFIQGVQDELGSSLNEDVELDDWNSEFGDDAESQERIDNEEYPGKMKMSEFKAKIKENILATLNEADEEVDVDIDVEDEVEVDAEADDIEIERPGVKTTVDVGLSPEEEIVQDSLKAAMDAAEALGSQKLADQIGNTITFFTRQFVVGQNTD